MLQQLQSKLLCLKLNFLRHHHHLEKVSVKKLHNITLKIPLAFQNKIL